MKLPLRFDVAQVEPVALPSTKKIARPDKWDINNVVAFEKQPEMVFKTPEKVEKIDTPKWREVKDYESTFSPKKPSKSHKSVKSQAKPLKSSREATPVKRKLQIVSSRS